MKEVAPCTLELIRFGQVNEADENGIEHTLNAGEEFYAYEAGALPYLLINAVKELKEMNDKQYELIETLQTEIEELRKLK